MLSTAGLHESWGYTNTEMAVGLFRNLFWKMKRNRLLDYNRIELYNHMTMVVKVFDNLFYLPISSLDK